MEIKSPFPFSAFRPFQRCEQHNGTSSCLEKRWKPLWITLGQWQTPGSTSGNAKGDSLLKTCSSLWIGWMWRPPECHLAQVMDGQDTPLGKQALNSWSWNQVINFRIWCKRSHNEPIVAELGWKREMASLGTAGSIHLKWSQAGRKDFLHKAFAGSGWIPKEMFDRAWLGMLEMRWCKCESAWPQRGFTNVP